jgi:hypothetical protein
MYTTKAYAALGRFYSGEACGVPGGVYTTAHGPELLQDSFTLQSAGLHLEVFSLQGPELHL